MTDNSFFFDTLQNYADAVAIICKDDNTLSYTQLSAAADTFALQLGQSRTLLLIEAVNELPAIIAYLAALRHRHPVILLPHMGANTEVNHKVIDLYNPNWLYQQDETGQWVLTAHNTQPYALHSELAVLLSTSGSTGTPKLVRLSRENLCANAQSIAHYLHITATDRAITALPFHYSYGLSVIHSHLLQGATLLLTDDSVVEQTFWDFFTRYQGTCFAGVPHTFELLERVDFHHTQTQACAHLRYITQAGGRMPVEKVKMWAAWATEKQIEFFVMYGQTEATARMSYLPPTLMSDYPEYIGYAIPQGEFSLIDEHNQLIHTPYQAGRLLYRGPNVMMGYALSPEDLNKDRELEQLITGDVAYRNEKGLYRIVGRESRFSKIFGLRIDLDAIEQFLREQNVQTVVSGTDESIAIGVLTGDLSVALLAQLAQRLKIPPTIFTVVKLTEMPLLPSGKVDYKVVLAQANAIRKNKNADESVSYHTFRETFRQALNLKSAPHDTDTFISLGGDSLTYVQVSLAIEKFLGYLPRHWEQISVLDLEQHLPKKKSAWADLDMEILYRMLAIIGVVFTHTNAEVREQLPWKFAGGANLLLLLAGFNIARFQAEKLFNGHILSVLEPFFRKIVLPYYLILISYQIWNTKFYATSMLLMSNYQSRYGFLEPYWFIEMLCQTLLIFTVPFALPILRQTFNRYPYLIGLLLFVLAVSMHVFEWFGKIGYGDRTPDRLLYIFLAGWCLYFSQQFWQKLTTTLLLLSTFWYLYGFYNNYSAWLVTGTLTLLWLPRIKTPQLFYTVVSSISAASFYIYLIHMLPVHLITHYTTLQNIPLIIAIAIGIGITVQHTLTRLGF